MRCVIYCGLSNSYHIFPTLSHKRHDFPKKKVPEPKTCVLILSALLSETFLILRSVRWSIIINVNRFSCKEAVILVRSWIGLQISLQVFEKSANIKFHENPSIGSRVVQCGRTDRRADMTKLISAFRNFANGPKKATWAKTAGEKWQKFNP